MNSRLNILNIWVDAITEAEAKRRVVDILRYGNRPHSVFASNPEKNFSIPRDRALYDIYRNADMLIPDGIGMVMAARFLHGKKISRIPGVEFMKTICRIAAAEDKSVFLYGAKEEVNQKAAEKLETEIRGLKIAGRHHGYVDDRGMPELIGMINDTGADILFLALGSPRQEKWYARYQDALKQVTLVQGIGGTLDTIAGNVKRAPCLWCDLNMEWLYRLLTQPARVRRQKVLPLFALQVYLRMLKQSET